MEDQRVPNLEEMDERQARRFLTELMSDLGADSGYDVRHEDFVMEMPQSGERIRGRERMREFQGAFPDPPAMRLRRVVVREGLWMAEVVSDYGGRRYTTCPSSSSKTARCGATPATTLSRWRRRSGGRNG